MDIAALDSQFEVRLLFFSSVADIVGVRSLTHSLVGKVTAAEALEQVISKFPKLAGRKLLFAVNQEYAGKGRIIDDGDEFAIFTAVSGG
jgi:molybdopterin converting factor small subunit